MPVAGPTTLRRGSSLQGRFAAVSTPGGGTAVVRGESFVSSVTSVLGGSYVLPGGVAGRGGSVIVRTVESPSVGGSTAYEVMAGMREQVISPVSDMVGEGEGEGLFSTPTGPRREGVSDPATGLLGSTLKAMNVGADDSL